METMNITLPTALKAFVEEQAALGSYGNVSEYIERLIREDLERLAREEIDRKLLEALDDGPAAPWTPEDLEELKRRLRERHPSLQNEA